jgi:ABC-2 type transport system ATP-binding protein
MKKRLSFARAIVNNPEVLILDEPTSGVDSESRVVMRELIENLSKEGKTIFFSSHDLEEVQKICSHISILKKGQILFEGSLKDIKEKFGYSEVFVVMKDSESVSKFIKKIQGLGNNIKVNGNTISFIPTKSCSQDLKSEDIISTWTNKSNLEEVYLDVLSSKLKE